MSFLTQMLAEHSGKPSTSRMLSVVVALVVVGCWAWISIHTSTLQPLSIEQLTLALGPMGFKVYQRGRESSTLTPSPKA